MLFMINFPSKIIFSRLSLSFSTLFFKRSMMSSATRSPLRLQPFLSHHSIFAQVSRNYATKTSYIFKGKAAKDLANDQSGKHPQAVDEFCEKEDCKKTDCPVLCDKPAGFRVKGHNTHKPPIGRMARFIHDPDADGKPKSQYFVLANTKKEITEKEKQNYGKDIKPNPKHKTFMDDHSDKYE